MLKLLGREAISHTGTKRHEHGMREKKPDYGRRKSTKETHECESSVKFVLTLKEGTIRVLYIKY